MAKNNKRRGQSAPKTPKAPKVKIDRGTLQTRFQHARAFLGIKDRSRLEMLVNVPVERLRHDGAVELPKSKRILTDTEEWAMIGAAVNEERERLFAKAAAAPHAAQRKDPIGRAWYEGLLGGNDDEAVIMRERGREYGWLYWGDLKQLDASMAGYDQRAGRPSGKRQFMIGGLTGPDAARFAGFETVLARMSHEIRKCVQKLCVDDMWWMEGPEWLDRCINTRRAERRARGEQCEPVFGPTARGCDFDTLNNAVIGLRALAQGLGR